MLKARKWQTIAITSAGFVLCVGLGGSLGWIAQGGDFNPGAWFSLPSLSFGRPQRRPADEDSVVLKLALEEPTDRQERLAQIANQRRATVERGRARYVLAIDAIAQLDGGRAIRLLENLEQDYPLLAPYVQLKRARAYELTNEPERSRAELLALIETLPDSPVTAEALVRLSQFDAQYGDRAIAEFPAHPRTQELVRARLAERPEQFTYLRLLAHHTPDAADMSTIRDRLVEQFSKQLQPEDWQAIADGYWEQWEYGKAASAYRRAPETPTNAYRIARGLDLSESDTEAKLAYENFVADYPESEEAGLAWLHLARLSQGEAALQAFDRAREIPEQAPTALLQKANRLEQMGRKPAAAQTRQQLLDTYPSSEAALDYRWQQAKKAAEQRDYRLAWQWAHPIAIKNPDSDLAPKASYWVGKWAERLNRPADAEKAYTYVLQNHPESYYAWRSATQLGLDVGDFTSIQRKFPAFNLPEQRPAPPAGSDVFRELYQLGQDEDAWVLWQWDYRDRDTLTVEEQFTQALLQGHQGNYLDSINTIFSLQERETEAEQEVLQALRQTPMYWHALFPFPFEELILSWSEKRQLNPLLVVSLMRQESRFQPEIRSSAGAIGLMQVMPATGEWIAPQAGMASYSLISPEDNIALGTYFLDYTHREFDGNSMLAIASYNAGPGNVSQWIKKYGVRDLDEFVEQIPFSETKGYVEYVFGNYWNYLRLYSPEAAQFRPN